MQDTVLAQTTDGFWSICLILITRWMEQWSLRLCRVRQFYSLRPTLPNKKCYRGYRQNTYDHRQLNSHIRSSKMLRFRPQRIVYKSDVAETSSRSRCAPTMTIVSRWRPLNPIRLNASCVSSEEGYCHNHHIITGHDNISSILNGY